MTMRSFQHIDPALRAYVGPDAIKQIEKELVRLNCQRGVVFCGPTLARSSLLDVVRSGMRQRCAGIFPRVRAHSPRSTIEEAVAFLRQRDADAIVAVGGGSAAVTARAAAILLAEGNDLEALSTSFDEGGRTHSPRLDTPKLPQLIIPTTPNTALVKAGTAVFDPVRKRRFALFDPKTRAQAVFIHPDFVMSAPRDLVISASLDTLSLAIEGLMSRSGDPISDALLIHAVRRLRSDICQLASKDDAGLRVDMALAALLAGRGTDYTGAGIATALGHAIGAAHHVENGLAKAVITPHTLRFNAEVAQPGLSKLAMAFCPEIEDKASFDGIIDALERMFRAIGVPRRLRDIGVPENALLKIAENGMADWFLRSNPRQINDVSELRTILEAAW